VAREQSEKKKEVYMLKPPGGAAKFCAPHCGASASAAASAACVAGAASWRRKDS
jgi:hypothetical protein